jgi:hypothetical protein
LCRFLDFCSDRREVREFDGGGIDGLNEHIRVSSVLEGRAYLYRLIKAYADVA